MKSITEALTRSTKYLLPVLQRSWLILTVTLVGCEIMHQYFATMAHEMAANSSLAPLVAGIGDLLTGLTEFTVLTMLIPQRVMELDKNQPPGSFWAFSALHVKPLTIEGIRAFAVAILHLFLLIIPGVLKYIRYTFVPYIVVADAEYQAGNVDALAESEKLAKGITLPLFILAVGSTAIDYWQGSMREAHSFTSKPLLALLATLGFFAVNFYINIFIFVLYQIRAEMHKAKGEHEAHIQLARS